MQGVHLYTVAESEGHIRLAAPWDLLAFGRITSDSIPQAGQAPNERGGWR